jgi:hypothetical protein
MSLAQQEALDDSTEVIVRAKRMEEIKSKVVCCSFCFQLVNWLTHRTQWLHLQIYCTVYFIHIQASTVESEGQYWIKHANPGLNGCT